MILQSPAWLTELFNSKLLSQFVAFLIGLGGLIQFCENVTYIDVLNRMFRAYKQGKIEDKGILGWLKRALVTAWGSGLTKYITDKIKEFNGDDNKENEKKEAQELLLDIRHWKFKAIVEGGLIAVGGVVSATLMLFSDDGKLSPGGLFLGLAELVILVIVMSVAFIAFKDKEEHYKNKYEALLQFESD